MPRVPAKRIRHFHSTPRFNSVEFAMFSAFGHPSEWRPITLDGVEWCWRWCCTQLDCHQISVQQSCIQQCGMMWNPFEQGLWWTLKWTSWKLLTSNFSDPQLHYEEEQGGPSRRFLAFFTDSFWNSETIVCLLRSKLNVWAYILENLHFTNQVFFT